MASSSVEILLPLYSFATPGINLSLKSLQEGTAKLPLVKFKKINEELVKNLIVDLDKSMREIGIGDMSIGKYVKKYVKKFYKCK